MFLKTIAQQACAFFICVISCPLVATQVSLVDSNGKPVSGAVIAIGLASQLPNSTQTTAIMDQIDYQFVPKTLVINTQQWVDFPNSDDVRHHVYSFSATKPFEIRMFTGSEAPPIQFPVPGIVVLGCNIHDSMVGYIYVSDAKFHAMSNEAGIAQFSAQSAELAPYINTNTGLISATLWHPLLSPANTQRINITLNPALAEQTLVLDIVQATPQTKKATTGFSSKFKQGH